MANKFDYERMNSVTALGRVCVEWAPDDVDLPPETKAVFFDTDATITFENPDGTEVADFQVKAGATLPFVPARVTAVDSGKCWVVS